MNRTQWYFFRQRLIGLVTVLASMLVALYTGDGTFTLITIPLGLYLMFTRKMVIQDKYFFEIEEEKLKKMQERS